MSGKLAAKVRVVRCPKCRQLLAEYTHFDVYKCGGCDTTLQAKKRKSDSLNSKSSTHEVDAAVRNALNHEAEDQECRNEEQPVPPQEIVLKAKAANSSSGECSLDENGGRDQNENGKCNGEQPVLPEEIDLRVKASTSSSGECSLDENGGSDETENGECCEEQPDLPQENYLRGKLTSFSSETFSLAENQNANGSSTELTHREIEASSVLMGENSVEETNNTNLQLAGVEELSDGKLLLEGAEEESIYTSVREKANIDKSAPAAAQSEVYISRIETTARSSSTEKFVSEKGNISHVTPSKPEEGSTSGNPISSNEQLKQAQEIIHHNVDCAWPVNTFDTTVEINQSSELSGNLGELCKSATTRSYHAYDGSISSCDGIDEWFPNHSNSFENSYSVANVASEGRSRKGKGPANGMTYGGLESQQHSMNFSSDLPSGKHHVMKDGKGNQFKVPETARHDRSVQHWMRTEKEEYPSRLTFHPSVSQSGYESGSPSNQMHDELYCSSSFVSHDSFEDPDQEKMKMLAMIYKLQDQLNRTNYLNRESNGRLSTSASYKEKLVSAYHSHELYDGRFHHDLDYSRYNGRCSYGINLPRQRYKFSRIPFSAEATSSTHHADHSCFHCYPPEWQCSAELRPHELCQNEELCRFRPGHNRCFSYHSYLVSPKWFMDSKLPLYGREIKSEDPRHRAYELKKSSKEKQNLAKRHFRPVAGGAPFVTCHNCFNLLQLPADFLLFKRVCHKLKCAACSEVLQFSLKNRSHIVSYAPNAIGLPPGEHNDHREVINGSNEPSASHANHYQFSHADSISYSDDYGRSASKSYSSEDDPLSLIPPHALHGSEQEPNVFRGAFEPSTEKEKISSRHSGASKAPMEEHESAGGPSNVSGSQKLSSEMKAELPPRGPLLHQLMGYSSPSQVIRGRHSSGGEGHDLTLNIGQ